MHPTLTHIAFYPILAVISSLEVNLMAVYTVAFIFVPLCTNGTQFIWSCFALQVVILWAVSVAAAYCYFWIRWVIRNLHLFIPIPISAPIINVILRNSRKYNGYEQIGKSWFRTLVLIFQQVVELHEVFIPEFEVIEEAILLVKDSCFATNGLGHACWMELTSLSDSLTLFSLWSFSAYTLISDLVSHFYFSFFGSFFVLSNIS